MKFSRPGYLVAIDLMPSALLLDKRTLSVTVALSHHHDAAGHSDTARAAVNQAEVGERLSGIRCGKRMGKSMRLVLNSGVPDAGVGSGRVIVTRPIPGDGLPG